jgi:hypothetical protein
VALLVGPHPELEDVVAAGKAREFSIRDRHGSLRS